LSDKYIPLFAMQGGGPLRLELALSSSPNHFVCSHRGCQDFELYNVEYIGNFIELSDSAMQIISTGLSPNGELSWVVPSYRNFVHNATLINNGTMQVSIPVPAKYSSLKMLLTNVREHSTGTATYFPLASGHYGCDEYNVRLGSRLVYSKAPSSKTEMFVEVLKALGSVSDIDQETLLDTDSYSVERPVPNTESTYISSTSSSSSFCIATDLESYSNADKTSIYSGINTANEDIFLNMTFTNGNANVRFDSYACFDTILTVSQGVCSARY
jgi:hypothetical protein